MLLRYCFKAKIRYSSDRTGSKSCDTTYDALALHQASPCLCECGLCSPQPHALLAENLPPKFEHGNWVCLLSPSIPDRNNKLEESYSMTDIGQYLPSWYLSFIILRPVQEGPTTSQRRPLSPEHLFPTRGIFAIVLAETLSTVLVPYGSVHRLSMLLLVRL